MSNDEVYISMSETWLPVPGREHQYSVSSDGRIAEKIPMDNGVTLSVIVEPSVSNGYHYVYLKADKEHGLSGCSWGVGNLVLHTFIGPKPRGAQVLHSDGDSGNNRLSNVYYGVRGDGIRNLSRSKAARGEFTKGRRYEIKKSRRMNEIVSEWRDAIKRVKSGKAFAKEAAAELGVSESMFSYVASGKRRPYITDASKMGTVPCRVYRGEQDSLRDSIEVEYG